VVVVRKGKVVVVVKVEKRSGKSGEEALDVCRPAVQWKGFVGCSGLQWAVVGCSGRDLGVDRL
jgi:hypothetical protein